MINEAITKKGKMKTASGAIKYSINNHEYQIRYIFVYCTFCSLCLLQCIESSKCPFLSHIKAESYSSCEVTGSFSSVSPRNEKQ